MTIPPTVLELAKLCQIIERQAVKAHSSALVLDLEGQSAAAVELEARARQLREKLRLAQDCLRSVGAGDPEVASALWEAFSADDVHDMGVEQPPTFGVAGGSGEVGGRAGARAHAAALADLSRGSLRDVVARIFGGPTGEQLLRPISDEPR
jgi:hypothetical protein